jgi:hypothetical protein
MLHAQLLPVHIQEIYVVKTIVTEVSIYLLLLSAVRLTVLNKTALQQYRTKQSEYHSLPHDGSLYGIDSNGTLRGPDAFVNSTSRSDSHLLIFVIHRKRLAHDIDFWNRVVELTSRDNTKQRGTVEYWGVCDSGLACNEFQPAARFTIIGHLDPYEMHIIAGANSREEALLYNASMRVQARIEIDANPSREAELILSHGERRSI